MASGKWKAPFFTIWGGQAFSLLGSQLVQFALVWWLAVTTRSATVLTTATTVGLLPTIFLGPFAGTLVDRWPRKWVLILSDGAIALVTGLLAVLFWRGLAQPWHVFVALFLRSLGNAFHNPAMTATTPLMVPREQLTRVAGMNATLGGIMWFVAPSMGALLLELIEVRGMLLLDVATALPAIVPLLFIAVPQPVAKAVGKGPRAVLQDLGAGLRYIWGWRGLRLFVATAVISGFGFQPIMSFAPLLITEHFHGGAAQLAWLQSTMGLTMVAGGVLLSAWGGLKRRMSSNLLGTAGVCLGTLLLGLAPSNAFWLAVVGCAVFGLLHPLAEGSQRAMLQTVIPPEMQGRYFAVHSSLWACLGPISLAIAGPLANVWGVRPFWLIYAGFLFLIILVRRFNREIYYIEDAPQR